MPTGAAVSSGPAGKSRFGRTYLWPARAVVPIGAGGKACERTDCAQRAFPQHGRALAVDEHRAADIPYLPAWGSAPR
ncbi:short-chain fatty acyl-CoA regulator family protein [Nocardia sp. NPDC058499]|uniref:short-chain fatty acyl-CoA regulator family protein n=1 Tax=Nocardia sp. NPDC058499 TaxID=3346530 RepID=UPI0036514F22